MSPAAVAPAEGGVLLGATGQRRRWSVSSRGAISSDGDDPPVDWHVAAEDRWHSAAVESTVRQRRVDGTPVVETRLAVPGGDVVQRVWAVPDDGGRAIVEFENESPRAVAVALTGPVSTPRPASDVAPEGIDLPPGTSVLPLGHRATVRAAVGADVPAGAIESAPPALAVARGWTSVVERASRLVLPDRSLGEAVVSARCDLLLAGPVDATADPAGFVVDVAEMVRAGEPADAWLVEVVGPAERLARAADQDSVEGLLAARDVATRAGDDRAGRDLDRILDRLAGRAPEPAPPPASLAELRRASRGSRGRLVRLVERRLADPTGGDGCRILGGGFPATWVGADFEVHGLPNGAGGTLGYAIRWHGARPAVLWEQRGPAAGVTAPDCAPAWSTDEPAGEALWPEPPAGTTRRPIRVEVG